MNELNRLYDPVIKAHHANPYHFKKLQAGITVKAYNPICGDKFEFYPTINGNRITEFYFHGYGCAVSMAAASVLVKSLEGKTVEDAISLCSQYLEMLNGKEVKSLPPELYAFECVRNFPARYACASLAGLELKKYLEIIRK
jgi:nitrogen fixation NifU-like protein